MRRLLLVVACLLATAVHAFGGEYRTVDVESLKITIDSEWGQRLAPGYIPIRFEITNLGDARVIEIFGQGVRFIRGMRGGQPGAVRVRQQLSLARGDRVRITVPIPVFADNENIRFEIREGSETLERFSYSSFQSGVVPEEAAALIVADLATETGRIAASWARGLPTATTPPPGTSAVMVGRASGAVADFVLPASRLPTNWLGFTSLRAVILTPVDWEQLAEAQKSALLTWTASGGDLLFVDGDPAGLVPAGQAMRGTGSARALGFGRIHLLTSASITATGLADVLTATAKLQDSNWSLPANRTRDWGVVGARGFRLPIPDVSGIPARAYLGILLVFSLLIGPVNQWFLWKKRQQVLLVLTAPLISLVFIVLLAGYVLAGEGLGVRGRAMTFTMLDQVRSQAVTRTSASLYAAGMTPGGGLRFARDTVVFPIGPDGSGSRESLVLDLTEAQRFSAGVIQARSPTNFDQITARPARERVTFSRQGSEISAVNGLGVPVVSLLYREGSTLYRVASLAPGARGVLQPAGSLPTNIVHADLPLALRLKHLVEHQPSGSYLAVLERSPFWEPGVSALIERGSFHLVIGWPAGQP